MAAGKCLLLVVVLLLLAFVTLTLFDIFIFFLFKAVFNASFSGVSKYFRY